MSLGPDDLVLCAGTLPQCSFRERVEVAAKCGFRGISIYLEQLEGLDLAEVRALLDDLALGVAELDPVIAWLPGIEPSEGPSAGAGFHRWAEAEFYRVADALSARSLNAIVFAPEPVEQGVLIDSFAGLCDRAREHGLLVHLEYMPFSPVRSLAGALEVVEGACRTNGGVMLDTWHHFRAGDGPEALEGVAGQRILAVQLDDAPREASGHVIDETLHRRLLPGEGDIGVAGMIRALDAAGCRAPLGVEVFSDELAAMPVLEAAERVVAAARAVVAEARGR